MARDGGLPPRVVLASASPRRIDLLRMFGVDPMVLPADVDETPMAGEKPAELVERLARAKANAARARLSAEQSGSPSSVEHLIVAADTVIDLDGTIFGKPVDDAEAAAMLVALSGRSHGVVTGMAVVGLRDGATVTKVTVERTEVWLRPLEADDIGWYISTGEPQGLGSLFVDRVEGSYQNVVGLPLPALDLLTRAFGYPLPALIRP